jgi:hypothetical protein
MSPTERPNILSEILNPSQHPALQEIQQLWEQGQRATEIVKYLDANDLPPLKVTSLARYGQRNWNNKISVVVKDKDINDIQDIITEAQAEGMTVKKVVRRENNGWGYERIDGVPVQVPRKTVAHTIEVIPSNDEIYEQATLPDIKIVSKGDVKPSKPAGVKVAVSVPDMQIGYFRDADGALTTTHDEAAIDVFHQILLFLQETTGVDLIVNQGDNLDFPMFSNHRTAPGYTQTTKLGIDRAGTEAQIQRDICPDSENVWIEGNHEVRLTNMIVDKLPELLIITRANEEEPVLSIPYLCRFEESKTKFVSGYPDGEYWASEGLRFVHGSLYSANKGGTANKYLASKVSTVFGHTHRAELLHDRQKTKDGGVSFWAGSAGCLARTDGQLPSAKTGITPGGKQNTSPKTEDWTQGILVITYDPNGTWSVPEPVIIEDGVAFFRGVRFESTVDVNGHTL